MGERVEGRPRLMNGRQVEICFEWSGRADDEKKCPGARRERIRRGKEGKTTGAAKSRYF